MNLRILLPWQMLMEAKDVSRIVVQTAEGSWGILPHRRDCVAAMVPSVLLFETATEGVSYVAVDMGVLVKAQSVVQVSVRRAAWGPDLASLRETVLREYSNLDRTELEVRQLSEKLETSFLRTMVALHHE